MRIKKTKQKKGTAAGCLWFELQKFKKEVTSMDVKSPIISMHEKRGAALTVIFRYDMLPLR